MNETVTSMNGSLWIFASLLIGMVVVQSLLFLRLTLNFNKKNKLLSAEEIKSAARTGVVSVIGPAISVIAIAFSLISLIGPAVTFLRCGVIGSAGWELLMANTSAEIAGVTFNSPQFTPAVFILCIFGMTFASAPYFINTIITLKPLDLAITKAQENKDEKKESFLPHLGASAMFGIMGYSVVDHLRKPGGIAGFITAMIITFIATLFIKKTGVKWLNDWIMAISMVVGLIVSQLFAMRFPLPVW